MKRLILSGLVVVLGTATLFYIPWPHFRYWISLIFLWVLPGLAWLPLFNRSNLISKLENGILGLGLNFALVPVLILLVIYLPGQYARLIFWISLCAAIIFLLIMFILKSRGEFGKDANSKLIYSQNNGYWWKNKELLGLIFILLLAATLRLVNIGYSEFQGDEAAVLVKAAQIVTGDEMMLFRHRKGPLELLLPLPGWDITGITNEWMARLPFTLASILGVGAIFLYARRNSSIVTGIIAAGLMAVEGYLVGFGRIVQYQSVVILLSTLALFCLLIYTQQGKKYWIVIAALFFAVGSWAHYDAILFLPAGVFLILTRIKFDRNRWRELFPTLTFATIIALLLVSLFYYPFLTGSQADGAFFYVGGRLGTEQIFHNHLVSTLERTFVYDSFYLLLLIIGGLLLQTIYTWRQWKGRTWVISIILLVACASTYVYSDLWQVGDETWAWIPGTLLILGSVLAPNQKPGARVLWLWFGIPILFYLYFVALPLTHVYTAVPGGVLLAGLGITRFLSQLSRRSKPSYALAGAAIILIFSIAFVYPFISFVRHTPEYVREYPDSKVAAFWTPFGEEIPEQGLFGFPYKAGWKTTGHLMSSGSLDGSYDSNEERDVTDYYMRGSMRFDCATPDIYVIAQNVQDEAYVRYDQIEAGYWPEYYIEVEGTIKSTIFIPELVEEAQIIHSSDYDRLFDLGTTPDAVAYASPAVAGERPDGFEPANAKLGDFAQLVGYQLDRENAFPGGYIELSLLWYGLKPAPLDYQVFTHLHDGLAMRGQLDGQPVCNSGPTSTWKSGDYIIDPYRIPINEDAETGFVPLTVGMYDLATLQRVPVEIAGSLNSSGAILIEEVQILEKD